MSSSRLNPLDAAWIMTETRATPNHVGGLLIFALPEGAPRDYMRRLMREFRNHRKFRAPWNRRLRHGISRSAWPVWVEDDDVDLEYHVRHAALPWPGGERELANVYRGNDAARRLSDEDFAAVLAFTRQGFDMAVAFRTAAAAGRNA